MTSAAHCVALVITCAYEKTPSPVLPAAGFFALSSNRYRLAVRATQVGQLNARLTHGSMRDARDTRA